MKMIERYVYLDFQLDANRINAMRGLKEMNKLETWYTNGVIHLEMSEVAQIEAARGEKRPTSEKDFGKRPRFEKAFGYIASEIMLPETPQEWQVYKKIESILFPQGATEPSQINDIDIVFKAYQDKTILITNDGGSKRQPAGILGSRDLLQHLNIKVMRDCEAVALVERKIKERDDRARYIANRTGLDLPEWVGKD